MRTAIRWTVVVALLALPLALAAQAVPIWTAVASTGTVDDLNFVPVNFATAGPALTFLGAAMNPAITARYNVTGLSDDSAPGWTTLELGAIDTSAVAGNQVQAKLFQVAPCTGAVTLLCTTTSVTNVGGVCTQCNFEAGTIDFNQFLYYVEVTISRTLQGANEQALTLRIY